MSAKGGTLRSAAKQTGARTVPARGALLPTLLRSNPHLAKYMDSARKELGAAPQVVEHLDRNMKEARNVNILYPVGDPVFIHVFEKQGRRYYRALEPVLTQTERAKYEAVRERVLRLAPFEKVPDNPEGLRDTLQKLFERTTTVSTRPLDRMLALLPGRKIAMTPEEASRINYHLQRDIVRLGVLEPIILDPYIEDVHVIGPNPIHIVHKIFDMVETNLKFPNDHELDLFLRTLGERIGRPVSESRPIVDATLPDGSRINIVYSDDVSQRGSSFTIRKFNAIPTSITELIKWGTCSAEVAAYLWLCLENGMSVFVCGETASGKTTLLNAILPFIRPGSKVFTAEDTPEVRPPHPAWQQLVTREAGPAEGRVQMFDLLKAALRSRPNYIIVGEIRGAEGNVAFQAMQTGHPCIATFHASSVGKMIQRFSAPPISVPITFMDNLNVSIIQAAVYHKGKMIRRVLAVEEIEGYHEDAGGVVTRPVFKWDPRSDTHPFRGLNNSFILEDKIAERAGYLDKRKIYEDLFERKAFLEDMISRGILGYDAVNATFIKYYQDATNGRRTG